LVLCNDYFVYLNVLVSPCIPQRARSGAGCTRVFQERFEKEKQVWEGGQVASQRQFNVLIFMLYSSNSYKISHFCYLVSLRPVL
jgi:hypothetical protein